MQNPLIFLFKETSEKLKTFLIREIQALRGREIAFLVETFPKKMELYSQLEAIGISIKASFSSFSENEQAFLKKTAEDLDALAENSALILKGMMIASQKVMDILIAAARASENPLNVYDRRARLENNASNPYKRR